MFECRPACTIEAVRITLSGRDCGPVGLFVLSPGSYKQLLVFERDELGTDEAERVEVFGVTLASSLDSLAFFVPGESFKPGDKIEVWARQSTFAEQREAAAAAAAVKGPATSTTRGMAPVGSRPGRSDERAASGVTGPRPGSLTPRTSTVLQLRGSRGNRHRSQPRTRRGGRKTPR